LDPNELFATSSDTAPAVPCSQPHQTETLWTEQMTGMLAHQRLRPNPELINTTFSRRCDNYWRARAYMAADPFDNHYGVSMLMKVPSPSEWLKGDRTLRCDALAGHSRDSGGPPSTTGSLRGVLRRKDSVNVRLCRVGGQAITCDQPHQGEGMSPNVILRPGKWPGDVGIAVAAQLACVTVAQHYLGVPPSARPELTVAATVPTQAQWDSGDRSADCWLQNTSGTLTTGTVRGGLT
jgi:hypothetical protein